MVGSGGQVRRLENRFYDRSKGWVDGTTQFAAMIAKRLTLESRILDLGAGSGKVGPVNFRGKVAQVVGLDPDEGALKKNSSVDAFSVGTAESMSFEDSSFDLVYSDWVLEHIPEPSKMASELYRVLKPGGWFLFRTGNLCHYSYAIGALTPLWFHRMLANRVRGIKGADSEPFRTHYRMNTRSSVRREMLGAGFEEEELRMVESEPSYLMFSSFAFLLGVAYERLVNRFTCLAGMRACLLGSFRRGG